MEWYVVVSYLLTNEVRLFLGLFFAAKLLDRSPDKKTMVLAGFGGCFVTALQVLGLTQAGATAAEILTMTAAARHWLGGRLRQFLFLTFFYEIGVGLWDFLLAATRRSIWQSCGWFASLWPERQSGRREGAEEKRRKILAKQSAALCL